MKPKQPVRTKGQRKTQDPCEGCLLHKSRCICHLIPSLNLKTRLVLVIHSKELKRTTNTGRLATLALGNSKLCVRGRPGENLDLSDQLVPEYESFLLYPSEDAVDLSCLSRNRKLPAQLIVPDGNWRQATKVGFRHKELSHLQRVKISPPPPPNSSQTRNYLRKEHFEGGMSTLEAIAFALGHFEGSEVRESLLGLYRAKLDATIEGRQPN